MTQDDCCDRSIIASEARTLHSQDDDIVEHRGGGRCLVDPAAGDGMMAKKSAAKGAEGLLGQAGIADNLPLRRFCMSQQNDGDMLEDGANPLPYSDRRREDD